MPVSTEILLDWTRGHTAVLASVTSIIGLYLILLLFVEYPFETTTPWRIDALLSSIVGYIILKIILMTRGSSTESDVRD